MLGVLISCSVWFLQTFLISCDENSPEVIRFSVPEDHHLCLQCGAPDGSRVVWTRRDGRVLATEQDGEAPEDRRRCLQPDGRLCLLWLDESDSGEYRCNWLLVAELQVLTGRDFTVSAGRTLLLPCSGSSKPRQRWFHRRRGGRREAIFTRFRNSTVRPKREGGRLSYGNDALQIRDLRPEDAGEYHCNGELQASVTVLTEHLEPTSIRTSASTSATSATVGTDVASVPLSSLLAAAVAGLASMIVLVTAICVLLTGVRCRRRRRRKHRCEAQRHEGAELQPWTASSGPAGQGGGPLSAPTDPPLPESPTPPEDTIHYASLGRRSWRERPGGTRPDRDQRHVIYSSVVTGPVIT